MSKKNDAGSAFGLTTAQMLSALRTLEPDAARHLTPSTFSRWAGDVLPPSIAWPRKRGRYSPRLYSLGDVARARLVLRLRHAGFSLHRVRLALAYVQGQLPDALKPRTTARLIVDGGHARIEHGTGQEYMLPLRDVAASEATVRKAVNAVKVR